jgi:hypothetical protein
MKKKVIALLIISFVTSSLIGCGNSKNTNADAKETVKQEQKSEDNSLEKTVDGVKFTISSVSREDVKGDRTKDNVTDNNGEYFANGSEIAKVTDYQYVVVKVNVNNGTDKAITLSQLGWSAKMKDGFELKGIIVSKELKDQMPSNYSVDGEIKILAEKKLTINEFELKYNLIDYSKMPDMIQDAISGKNKDECKTKYPELFKENYAKFNIEVK